MRATYGVTIFYTAPTAIRVVHEVGRGAARPSTTSRQLRLLGTVGEPINPKAWLWYCQVIGWRALPGRRHLVADRDGPHHDHDAARALTHMKPGSAGTPLPGVVASVVDESTARRSARDKQGLLAAAASRGPAMLRTLYSDDDRFVETYFEKFGPETYFVGDAARQDDDDYFWIIGRVDDVLNVSGHRMSTAEIESAIVSHEASPRRRSSAQSDEDTGQSVDCFVTLEGDREGNDELVAEIREHVAKQIGKLARPKRIIWADDLPKTRSGKIMRRLLRDIAEGRELGDVTTLRDPDVMQQLQGKISEHQEEEDSDLASRTSPATPARSSPSTGGCTRGSTGSTRPSRATSRRSRRVDHHAARRAGAAVGRRRGRADHRLHRADGRLGGRGPAALVPRGPVGARLGPRARAPRHGARLRAGVRVRVRGARDLLGARRRGAHVPRRRFALANSWTGPLWGRDDLVRERYELAL